MAFGSSPLLFSARLTTPLVFSARVSPYARRMNEFMKTTAFLWLEFCTRGFMPFSPRQLISFSVCRVWRRNYKRWGERNKKTKQTKTTKEWIMPWQGEIPDFSGSTWGTWPFTTLYYDFPHGPGHSLTHAIAHSFTHSVILWLIHQITHAPIESFIHYAI